MSEIVILRGYPASGKTTFARRHSQNYFVSSRDELRTKLFGLENKGKLDYASEKLITDVQKTMVRAVITAGRKVIIDGTNLRAKHARQWVDLAVELGVPWQVIDFSVSAFECLKRNSLRPIVERVPGEVIEDYGRRFPIAQWPVIEPTPAETVPVYIPNITLPFAHIFDIDGTLSIIGDRDPYDASRCLEDTPNWDVCDVLIMLSEGGSKIIFVSGRSEDHRKQTEEWLYQNIGFAGPLYMRASGDSRKDSIVKSELFDTHIAPYYWVAGVFDDRQQVVDMWRAKGLTCFQVAEGNF